MNLNLQSLNDFTKPYRAAIIGVLAFLIVGFGLKIYVSSRLASASVHEEKAQEYKKKAEQAELEASRFKATADQYQNELVKANQKIDDLVKQVAQIKTPPKPEAAPDTGTALSDLQKLGLELVIKPSMQVKPSVAGITREDVSLIWKWGFEYLRVPALELKIEKQGGLIVALEDGKKTAEKALELRTKEADAYSLAAEAHAKEAMEERKRAEDLQKALKAERKKKILYGVGGAALAYAVARR